MKNVRRGRSGIILVSPAIVLITILVYGLTGTPRFR